MNLMRLLAVAAGLVVLWQGVVLVTGVPHFILPGPLQVFPVFSWAPSWESRAPFP